MYKAKLQELSQQKRWGLPRYTAMKDGPDHLPHFKASVYVNGLSFHSPTISTSSKQAHNQAAKLAFLHFASSSGSSTTAAETMAEGQNTEEAIQSFESHSSTLAVTNCSLKPMGHQDDRDSNIGKKYQSTEIHSHALAVKDAPRDEKPKTGETNHSTETHSHGSSVRNGEYLQDLQYQYKSQLQNYARSKNLDAPLYSSKCDGPHHALRFKATVTIDGHTFGSPEFFNTLKKAEHAAAKVALMSLLQDDFQEDDSGFYKNVLLELAQKELFCIPKYETVKCGPSHMPTFFSTVKVDGEIFHGKAGRSKKQAEMKAAKAAYTAFKDRESFALFPLVHQDGELNLLPLIPQQTRFSNPLLPQSKSPLLTHSRTSRPNFRCFHLQPSTTRNMLKKQKARVSTPLLAPIKSSLLTQKSMLYPDAHCFHPYLLAMRNMLKKIKMKFRKWTQLKYHQPQPMPPLRTLVHLF
eukprot:XP_019075949.1 PREDICTED: double-stranded RNA-binding protein 3-like isoform X7 [Vitis vinifera]